MTTIEANEITFPDVTEAIIAEIEERSMELSISGVEDKKGLAMVHSARMEIKKLRVAVEKRRKELKADALEYGRRVDAKAKKFMDKLLPIEARLKGEEDRISAEKERIKREAEEARKRVVQGRVNKLQKLGADIEVDLISDCSEEEFADILATAETEFEERKAREEEEARQRAEQAERERQEREAEQKRLAAERAELERMRAKQEAEEKARREAEEKRMAEAHAKADAELKAQQKRQEELELERQALERERAAIERERRQVEEERRLEQARKEAAEQARLEEQERAQAEAQAKAEEEERARAEAERREAMRPDLEKALAWIAKIQAVTPPEVKDAFVRDLLANAQDQIQIAFDLISQSQQD